MSLQATRPTLDHQGAKRRLNTAVKSTDTSFVAETEIEGARERLAFAAKACARWGWLSFWLQLILATASSVILLLSLILDPQAG